MKNVVVGNGQTIYCLEAEGCKIGFYLRKKLGMNEIQAVRRSSEELSTGVSSKKQKAG